MNRKLASLAVVTLGLSNLVIAADLNAELAACRAIATDAERFACYEAIAADTSETVPPSAAPPVTEATRVAAPAAVLTPEPVPETEPASAAPASVIAPEPVPEPEPVIDEEQTAEDVFGKTAGQLRRDQQKRFGKEELRQLEATVVKLRRMGNYKVEITLDSGQRWHQITSSYLKLKVGDKIVIKRAALDSYKLVKVGNNRSMQVRRAD